MDSNYLKQSVGPAITAALTDLILHGHTQTHPSLSINPETNTLSTSLDPITYVARYLINHTNAEETIKRDEASQEKVRSIINKIKADELKKKLDEANRIRQEQEAIEREKAEKEAAEAAALEAAKAAEAAANPPPPPAEIINETEAPAPVSQEPAPTEPAAPTESAEAPKEAPAEPTEAPVEEAAPPPPPTE